MIILKSTHKSEVLTVRFQCPYCKTILDIDDCQPGELVACGKCGNAVNVPMSKTAPGAIIGDFVVLREIGTGGMGTVFLAHQISLDRDPQYGSMVIEVTPYGTSK